MSVFLDRTADTPAFRILEYFLEARETDHAVGDVLEATGIARSTFYAAWPTILANGYVKRTRTVGKTNLYAIHLSNPYAKRYAEIFDLALREKPKRKLVV